MQVDTDPRLKLKDRQNFSKGEYLAFAVPWAAESGPMRHWSNHADTVRVDPPRFPDNTAIRFAWPPFSPRGGIAGVWGYMGIGHGNYDGGAAEAPVTPRRVDDISALSQSFAWSYDFRLGVADVLTEFYLRSNPDDNESKLIEIGWFLHTPEKTRHFVETGQQIGKFVEAGGRTWIVARNEKFVTFMPEGGVDVLNGRIDMLAALRWLKSKKVITGREWYNGVAIGVEPFKGTGHIQIDRWSVGYR
ncbi:GH12 family glycosyl hydrolase domain-containing protein [Novosphingobium album (ex Liu et al. 2023)]|nr:hypothetical protein [Novosphingobium album (ex Liu et al. 2023)]